MNFWKRFFTRAELAEDSLESLYFRYVQVLVSATLILSLAVLIVQRFFIEVFPLLLVPTLFGLACFGLAQLLIARRYLLAASTIMLVALTTLALIHPAERSILLGALALLTAAVLGNNRVFIAVNVAIFAKQVLLLREISLSGDLVRLPLWIMVFLSLVFASMVIRYFIRATHDIVRRTQYHTSLLDTINALAHYNTMMRDIDVLLSQTVNFIRDELDMYHAQVFLVDGPRDYAVLHSSTGDAGKQLLARRHRLSIDPNSVVGLAAADGKPVVVLNTQQDRTHRFNEVLPDTRSEMAVPVKDGDTVIGVLDVQRTRINAFDHADIRALQAIASSLALAIRTIRLMDEQERNVGEQQRLLRELETSWREIHRLNQEITQTGWADYMGYETFNGVTLQGGEVSEGGVWSVPLIQASHDRRPVVTTDSKNGQVIAVPLLLRGEIIGAMEIETDESQQEEEIVALIALVADRLAVSLENARLFEEAQAKTAQEHQLNQLVTRYQEGTDVGDLLRITLSELSENLGAQRSTIRLGTLPVQEEGAS